VHVAVDGATGLIGSVLVHRLLADGDDVTALVRDPARAAGRLGSARLVAWDPVAAEAPADALADCDAVVHLAGEPIGDWAWTTDRKRRIRDSRVVGTRNLVAALRRLGRRPRVLVSGSAIGYYGDRGDELLDESSAPGDDFLAQLCRDWEREAMAAEELGVRVVRLRTGLVLANEGGAFPRLVAPFRFFVGGPLGSGRQWMSWIHLDDEIGLIVHCLRDDRMAGALNAVAPSPVRNAAMARAIARILGRPALLPAPGFALRLLLGERVQLLLDSQRVAPRAALAAGYTFRYPTLEPALRSLLRP
jgi:uncharacterized protein (TIGR01777 family)